MAGSRWQRLSKVVVLLACAALMVFAISSLSVSSGSELKKKPSVTGPSGAKGHKKCKHKHRHTHGHGVGQLKHNHKHNCYGNHHKPHRR